MEPWKLRFIEEYKQLNDRCAKLMAMLAKYHEGTLEFTPNCDIEILFSQLQAMEAYRSILKARSKIEDIPLN